MSNIAITNVPVLKGIVHLKLTNCETGELEWEHTEENIHYIDNFTTWLDGNGWWSSATSTSFNTRLYISEQDFIPNFAYRYMQSQLAPSSTRQAGDLTNTLNTTTGPGTVTPEYYEFNQKFNAPTNTRIINSLYVGNNGSTSTVSIQYVNLTVPCRQLGTTNNEGRPGQDLTVLWRTEVFFDTRTSGTSGVSTHPWYGWYLALQLTDDNTTGGNGAARWPQNTHVYWQTNVAEGEPYDNSPRDTFTAARRKTDSRVRFGELFKQTFTQTLGTTDDVGEMFGQWGTGKISGSSPSPAGLIAWLPVMPPDFAGAPIQPIHNHGPSNEVPFQDTDELARKNGILQITEGVGGWEGADDSLYPQMFRLDITTSGDTGVSRYTFRVRNVSGFDGNTWRSHDSGRYDRFGAVANATIHSSFKENYVGRDFSNDYYSYELAEETPTLGEWVEWTWEARGVSYHNQISGAIGPTFSDTTTPALGSATGTPQVTQVAIEPDGTLWVADMVNGLHKITDPKGSPTVTTYTATTIYGGTPPGPAASGSPIGAANGDAFAVYGVAVGFGGRIWTVVDGALCWTENSGASWTAYDSQTVPRISDPDLDGLYSEIRFLRCDIGSEDHELALCKDFGDGSRGTPDTDHVFEAVWWRASNGGENPGKRGATYWDDSTNRGTINAYGFFRCSPRGDWYSGYYGTANGFFKFEWGSGSVFTLGHTTGLVVNTQALVYYDWYGTGYYQGVQADGATDTVELWHFDQQVATGAGSTIARSGLGYVLGRGNAGISHTASKGLNSDGNMRTVGPGVAISGYNDTLNGESTPFHMIVWDNYRWDSGSSPQQWRKNWNRPADDTSGNNFAAPRIGFDTEDHVFTSISAIDIGAVFIGPSPHSLTDRVTFVMTVKGQPKKVPTGTFLTNKTPGGTADRALVGMGAGRREHFTLFWDWDGQIRVEDETGSKDVGPTPGDWSGMAADIHRIVFVVDIAQGSPFGSPVGGSPQIGPRMRYRVYLDGSKIGSFIGAEPRTDLSRFTDAWLGATSMLRPHGLTHQFAGYLEDVQIWEHAWTPADVSADHAAWVGTKTPSLTPPAGSPVNLLARYVLTESLTDTETKLTHGTEELLAHNINAKFTDSSDTPAFEADDWYTVGIYNGIMKDNAIDFSSKFSLYWKPTDTNHTALTNVSGTAVIPSTVEQHTEALILVDRTRVTDYNGTIGCNTSAAANWANFGGKGFQHLMTGTNGYIQWKVASPTERTAVGFADTSTGTFEHTTSGVRYSVRFNPGTAVDYNIVSHTTGGAGVGKWVVEGDHLNDIAVGSNFHVYDDSGGAPAGGDNGPFEVSAVALVASGGSPAFNTEITIGAGGHVITGAAADDGKVRLTEQGTIDVYENGSLNTANVARYYKGDEFRIYRDGTTGNFIFTRAPFGSPPGGSPVLDTSTVTYTGDAWPRVNFEIQGGSIYDATINYVREAYTLNIGSFGSPATGKYHPEFLSYDNEDVDLVEINLTVGGSPIVPASSILIDDDTPLSDTTTPSISGEVILCEARAGVLKFHSSDAGKTVSGRFTVIYNK